MPRMRKKQILIPFRTEMSALLLEKLYVMGVIPTKWDLENANNISASSFWRRNLLLVLVRNKMSENVSHAIKMVEHGHVRVGVGVVKDLAFLVPHTLQDFVTWVDSSAIRKHLQEYDDMRDDFEDGRM
ncbi:U3 small nucleolar ribonucleoprotein protein IMP3-like [Anopheles nili]|uniref:U3 small nucleolar ribonucleoprotein protein IMP3-like n=1 Tax=Anopheles nili TaxID=185578 RepID=UPI00237C3273|nr:U3 small nucleolar ribonucleoprotein protein IMP3-like [Anopheles nili]